MIGDKTTQTITSVTTIAPVSGDDSASAVHPFATAATISAPPRAPNNDDVDALRRAVAALGHSVARLHVAISRLRGRHSFCFNGLHSVRVTARRIARGTILSSSLFELIARALCGARRNFRVPGPSKGTRITT